ncbi:hypothetical protein SLS53_008981 [Cytospora paraplurivora]|uniref:Uncharacterized protein n=1 Tax=Cytospora paraplurivora TaxID=2898453 RepID=A0AAN9TZ51_9PEZI
MWEACDVLKPIDLPPDLDKPDAMFTKFKSSLKVHKTRHSTGSFTITEHVCHACGQTVAQSNDNTEDFAARPYEVYEKRERRSWRSSGFSDSGYGSFNSSQDFDPLIRLGATQQPEPHTQEFPRHPTHTPGNYLDDDELEDLSASERVTDPAGFETPEYMYEFSSSPPSFNRESETGKSQSRYARLNELPVASPGTLPSQHAALEAEIGQDEIRCHRKRSTLQSLESLLVGPSSLGRLVSRRMRID